jgi:hypothetical protein
MKKTLYVALIASCVGAYPAIQAAQATPHAEC